MKINKKNIWASILILVGITFFLKNNLNIEINIDVNWYKVWPTLLIFIGGTILFNNYNKK